MIKGLYAITNEALMPGPALLWKAEAALAGGCRVLQYRNKTAKMAERQRQAESLRELCTAYQALLIINDSVDLAVAVGAHGVHLGQSDETPLRARQQLGDGVIIGATCHGSMQFAAHAVEAGADYLAFGRFFPSRTKPQAPAAGLELLSRVKRQFQLPLVAIGGINRDNAAALITAGADSIAVSHDLFEWQDPEQIRQCAAFYTSLFASHPTDKHFGTNEEPS